MKKYLTLIAMFAAVAVQAQKLDEISKKSQEDFNKEWQKIVQYGHPATKNFKPKEDGSGTMPMLSKLPSVPKRVALVTFTVFDAGQHDRNSNYIYTYSITESGGNYFCNKFLEKGLPALKANFAAQGMTVLTPDEFLDTPEKKEAYRNFNPDMSAFASIMESAMGKSPEKGVSAVADNYSYYYIGDGRDFKLSESMGAALCKALGVDAVLSVVNNVSTDTRYFGLNKVNLVMHGPNPTPRIEGHKYRGAMGANYQDGHLYQANWMDVSFLYMEKHKKKGTLFETYDGYDRIMGLLSKTMADNIAARCQGKIGDLKGN